MNENFSVRDQFCPNPNCILHTKILAGNVIVHGKRHPRFKCKECEKTWVAGRNGTYYRIRSDIQKIERTVELLNQGVSVRNVARLVGIVPGTVQRWKKLKK